MPKDVLLEGQFQILHPTTDVYMKKDDFETQSEVTCPLIRSRIF